MNLKIDAIENEIVLESCIDNGSRDLGKWNDHWQFYIEDFTDTESP